MCFLNFTFGWGLGGLGISACPSNSQADELLTDTEETGAAMGEGAEEAKGGAAEDDDLEVRGRAWGFGSVLESWIFSLSTLHPAP